MEIKFEDIIKSADARNKALEILTERIAYRDQSISSYKDAVSLLNKMLATYEEELAFLETYQEFEFNDNSHDAIYHNYEVNMKVPDFKLKDNNYTVDLKVYQKPINYVYACLRNEKFESAHGANALLIYSREDGYFYVINKYDYGYGNANRINSDRLKVLKAKIEKILKKYW